MKSNGSTFRTNLNKLMEKLESTGSSFIRFTHLETNLLFLLTIDFCIIVTFLGALLTATADQ